MIVLLALCAALLTVSFLLHAGAALVRGANYLVRYLIRRLDP